MELSAIKNALLSWAPFAAYGGLALAVVSFFRNSVISRDEKRTQMLQDAQNVQRHLSRRYDRFTEMEFSLRRHVVHDGATESART